MEEISWKLLFCFLLLSLMHYFLLLHYGKYLTRQHKNHLVICKGRVFISFCLSALIFSSRLYYLNMLYLELPLKTTYRLQLFKCSSMTAQGPFSCRTHAYSTVCLLFKMCIQGLLISIRVLHYPLFFFWPQHQNKWGLEFLTAHHKYLLKQIQHSFQQKW